MILGSDTDEVLIFSFKITFVFGNGEWAGQADTMV